MKTLIKLLAIVILLFILTGCDKSKYLVIYVSTTDNEFVYGNRAYTGQIDLVRLLDIKEEIKREGKFSGNVIILNIIPFYN